jgi:hypothetical protein
MVFTTNPASAAAPTGFGVNDLRLGDRSSEDNRTKTNLQAPRTLCVLGGDPGLFGAIAFYSTAAPDRVAAEDMPTVAGDVDCATLAWPLDEVADSFGGEEVR